MSEIFVDADGCPVKEEVYRVAGRYGLHVTLAANSRFRVPDDESIELVVVGDGFDEADDWIVDHLHKDDIVITADIPLAARCLEKGAQNGCGRQSRSDRGSSSRGLVVGRFRCPALGVGCAVGAAWFPAAARVAYGGEKPDCDGTGGT